MLVVGTGLTSADVVASLDRRGFRGDIVALSRHGLRSRGHGDVARKSEADFPAPTARALVRRIRDAVAADAASGQSWHATLDRVREQGQDAWGALDARERARLVRHLRSYWDVHRFRVAPQVEEVLDARVARGTLTYVAAHLASATETPDGIIVEYRPRHTSEIVTDRFDNVVVTTGPSHRDALRTNPVLRSMAADGLLSPIPSAWDCWCPTAAAPSMLRARCPGRSSSPDRSPAGHVGELMGLPEVTAHAETVAAALSARISARVDGPA